MYGSDVNQISAIPHGGAALGVAGGGGLALLGWWQTAVLVAVGFFAVAAAWTTVRVLWHRVRS